jgi:outer membrane protein insertion porin family
MADLRDFEEREVRSLRLPDARHCDFFSAFGRGGGLLPHGWTRKVIQFLVSLSVCLGFLASPRAGAAAQMSSAWGKRVASIRMEGNAAAALRASRARILQKTDEPLDPALVDKSLKSLYATGRFRDLRADAEPAESGVVLIFVGQAQFFAGNIHVEGTPRGLEAQGLETASHIRLGQPLDEKELDGAGRRLAQVLSENGYYQAKIAHRIVPNLETQEADIVFTITPGQPAKLSGVDWQGETIFPKNKLDSVAGWRRGRQLTSVKLEHGLSKLHQFFVKKNRLMATTSVLGRKYDSRQNTERLLVQVEAGQPVVVRIRGARVSGSQKKQLLPMYTEGVADSFAVSQGEQNLTDYFQRQGYFSVSVKGERTVRQSDNEIDITYGVYLGPQGVFDGFAFEGNRNLSQDDLQSVLSVQPSGFFHDRGIFSQQMLSSDLKSLTDLYQSQGYLEAKVTPRLEKQHNGVPNHLFVTFAINEGDQTMVSGLDIHGVDEGELKRFWSHLLAKPGQPYSEARVERDRDTIQTYFNNHGYALASVDPSTHAGPGAHEMSVEYQITLGPQETISNLFVMGNRHTRPKVIRRELQFHAGEPLSQSSMLESQRRLYDLGVFNQVQIAPQDAQGPAGPKNVIVNVNEAKRWTLGYGFGAEVQRLGSNQPQGNLKASPRFSLDVSRLNVGGRAQTLSFQGRLSTLDKGASLSYYIPRFPTRPDIHLRLNALVDRSSDVLTFTSEREEASISLEKSWSHTTLMVGRLNFRNVKALNLANTISVEQIPLVSRAARIGMVGLSYINDHRDNPVDATRGSFSVADAGISTSTLASEANFLRFSGENSTYYRLARHLIFARDTRFAFETPYGSLRKIVTQDVNGNPVVTLTHDIPLPERFFMGGSESHRGFSINQAGPRDPEKGFPIGGNALFLNSLELRMPFAQNRLGFVLFHDAGNVYSSVRLMRLLKVHQSSPGDFDYTVHAVGFGFRYKTPVGPLRFDIGYSLNPPRYKVVNSPGNVEVLQLSHFQYFLGIGQSF